MPTNEEDIAEILARPPSARITVTPPPPEVLQSIAPGSLADQSGAYSTPIDQWGAAVEQYRRGRQQGIPAEGFVPKQQTLPPPAPAAPLQAPMGSLAKQPLPAEMATAPFPTGQGLREQMLTRIYGEPLSGAQSMQQQGAGVAFDLTPAASVLDVAEGIHTASPTQMAIGAAGMIPGARPAAAAARTAQIAERAAARAQRMGGLAEMAPPLERTTMGMGDYTTQVPQVPTGRMNPLQSERIWFNAKPLKDLSPDDYLQMGQHYGTEKPMGPLSPVETVKGLRGQDVQIPGGTKGEWTYYDLLWMKANPINPNDIPERLHVEMQKKLGRTHTPVGEPSDAHVWSGLIFGMTSPANPLFSNQLAMSRLRLRDPAMLDDLASMIHWKPGEGPQPSKQERLMTSARIADRYGLGKASAGGLGVRGNADYTRVAELAHMFRENPEFFRRRTVTPGANRPDEPWDQFVERISSQVPGLSMKTGSFGTVWQAPAEAAISAIDRHMARKFHAEGGVFASPAEQAGWEARVLKRYNKGRPKADQAESFEQVATMDGTESLIGGMLLEHVGATSMPKLRLKGGELNPNVPEHLRNADWVTDPKNAVVMGTAYRNALRLNQQLAEESGLSLFMSQWLHWDKIRNRFEPHENMFPGLEKLPAPTLDELRGVQAAHRATGHAMTGKLPKREGDDVRQLKPTKPFMGNPSELGYLAVPGAILAPSVLDRSRRDQ